jgi:hypothetical protein
MDRAIATYRVLLEDEIERWRGFKRALRKTDQLAFNKLERFAKMHSSTQGSQVNLSPFETMVMSMILELKKELNQLKSSVEARKEERCQ